MKFGEPFLNDKWKTRFICYHRHLRFCAVLSTFAALSRAKTPEDIASYIYYSFII